MSQSTRLRLPCAQSHSPTVPKTGHLYGQKGTQKPFLTLPPLAHTLSKTLWQTQSLEQLFKSPCSNAGDTVMVRHQTVITHYTGEWCPGKDPEGQCPVQLAELTGGRVLCWEEQASLWLRQEVGYRATIAPCYTRDLGSREANRSPKVS